MCCFFCEIVHLTPPGRGAVGSFLLCGEKAINIFLRHWTGKKPRQHPTWGRLQLSTDGDHEEAVVHYVADNLLEMHVHGGERIASAIDTLFQQNGAVVKTWQEHFASGVSQQELALRLLPFAPTERTVQILLDQYNGAYDREIAVIRQLSCKKEQQRHLIRLQELASAGKHLVEPFRVVLAGASNAGKSTLLNTILGFQRSIVHSTPGTTRDIVSGQTALDGFPVMFLDTAGFRSLSNSATDDLERQGIDQSKQSLSGADLIVWIIDPTVKESKRPACPTGANVLYCINKMDLVLPPHSNLPPEGEKVRTNVSALTGAGIETLLTTIICRLVPSPPKPGEAVPL